jgi:hypothetical protein
VGILKRFASVSEQKMKVDDIYDMSKLAQ